MSRALTPKNLYEKQFETYEFEGIFKEIFGTISKGGIWILYGKDKNGKSWASLIISNMMRKLVKVLYISAEEGTDLAFIKAMKRAKIPAKANNLTVIEYEPIEELYKRLKKQRAPRFVVIDNTTVYGSELKKQDMINLTRTFPKVTFLIVAHEERNKPYTASAVMAHKLAKIIMRVKGFSVFVSGRCPGGHILIDQEKAMLFHGTEITA